MDPIARISFYGKVVKLKVNMKKHIGRDYSLESDSLLLNNKLKNTFENAFPWGN